MADESRSTRAGFFGLVIIAFLLACGLGVLTTMQSDADRTADSRTAALDPDSVIEPDGDAVSVEDVDFTLEVDEATGWHTLSAADESLRSSTTLVGDGEVSLGQSAVASRQPEIVGAERIDNSTVRVSLLCVLDEAVDSIRYRLDGAQVLIDSVVTRSSFDGACGPGGVSVDLRFPGTTLPHDLDVSVGL